jgi:type III secretory pathway component EscR
MSGESIEEYSVTSAPNLKAYPTTLFYTYDVCSTALKCSDKLICGYNDFKRHEGELAKDTVNNLFYVFEKNTDTDEYEWREIDSNEYLELLPAYSMIRITKDFVEIYAMLNNKLGCINISPDGVKASKLYCC